MVRQSAKDKKATADKKKKAAAKKTGKKRAWPMRTFNRLTEMGLFIKRIKGELERSDVEEDIVTDCTAVITYIDGLIEQIGKLPADWKPKGMSTRGVLQVGDVVTFKDDAAVKRYAFLHLDDDVFQFTIKEVFDIRSVMVTYGEDDASTLILKRHLSRV